MSKKDTIFKNVMYSVQLAKDKYAVVNNETGITEFETTLMPEALHYAIELQNDLYKVQEKIEAEATANNVVVEH